MYVMVRWVESADNRGRLGSANKWIQPYLRKAEFGQTESSEDNLVKWNSKDPQSQVLPRDFPPATR